VPGSTLGQADRVNVTYVCPSDHTFPRAFAGDVAVPDSWDCPRCGKLATPDMAPSAREAAPGRTHWDMVLERRTLEDLSHLLDKRIKELRAGE